MEKLAEYKKMTAEEKKVSLNLWKQFYESLQDENYEQSWLYWNERRRYLNEIGIRENGAYKFDEFLLKA